MGRRDFIRDLNAAAEGPPAANIGDVRMDEDGEGFSFQYNHGFAKITTFNALLTDNASYPKRNGYFINADNASINLALQEIQDDLEGLTIHGLITKVCDVVDSFRDGTEGSPMVIDTRPGSPDVDSLDGSGPSQPESDDDDDAFEYTDELMFGTTAGDDLNADDDAAEQKRQIDPESAAKLNKRIVEDLKHLKLAGYRIGILQGMKADSTSSMLSISLRVAKLGLSDEVLQAWNLARHHYLVLLIHYSNGYVEFEDVLGKPNPNGLKVAFRIGVNTRYKPTLDEAMAAFSTAKRSSNETYNPGRRRGDSNARPSSPSKSNRSRSKSPAKGWRSPRSRRFAEEETVKEVDLGFRLCFISSPMRQLMDEIFLHLVRIRHTHNCGWEGAKNHLRGQNHLTHLAEKHEYQHIEEIPSKKVLPDIVTADHLKQHEGETMSLPLIAMQFTMLYLMRCTEFCLVCHRKTDESFEAIKPYVCSNPLCLYQYMGLGFGPSIEHEILTQPYVVDLLISFCYAGALSDRLRGYPDGMGLSVPSPPPWVADALGSHSPMNYLAATRPPDQGTIKPQSEELAKTHIPVHYDVARRLVELDPSHVLQKPPRSGDWIQLAIEDPTAANRFSTRHYRVEKYMHPFIHFYGGLAPKTPKPGASPNLQPGTWTAPSAPAMSTTEESVVLEREGTSMLIQNGTLFLYTLKFDDLTGPLKSAVIVELLSTLPSVHEMAEYLSQNGASEARLISWTERISQPALSLLRWIVASNRSCIVQVDQAPGQTAAEAQSLGVRLEQKLTGLNDWMQFRFAQGAPDKEDKFHKASEAKKDVTGRFPSMFAWHGSNLANWHSIIRQGLDFNDTLNGRAYGHGVYCSTEFNTSLGYSNHSRHIPGSITSRPLSWSPSSLDIQAAICLNEIVNSPSEFVSQNPHLVIQYTEWIQCRYLLVQCIGARAIEERAAAAVVAAAKNAGDAFDVKAYAATWLENKTKKTDPSGPFIVQDPVKFITNLGNSANGSHRVMIPRSAFSLSRSFLSSKDGRETPLPINSMENRHPSSVTTAADGWEDPTPRKKRKSPNGKTLKLPLDGKKASNNVPKEVVSDDSDLEDIAFFCDSELDHSASQSFSGLGIANSKPNGAPKGPIIHDENGKPLTDFVPGSLDRSTIQQLAAPPYGTSAGNRRLQQDLRALLAVQNSTPLHELGWYIDGDSISNLYQWIIELHSFPSSLPLSGDMRKSGIHSIVLEIRFGATYPMEPPFVRVIRPRFLPFMNGGGGHVTAGGALCMELLTNSGWSAVSSIESVLLQVRMAVMSEDPKPARLMGVGKGEWGNGGRGGANYGVGEAIDAYERACKTHGWKFPDMRTAGGTDMSPQQPQR